MSDPLRTNPSSTPASADGDAERDAKIEHLLISGLDQYFAGAYAQAIDIWTRALFLDRNHARARAYIERARSAMAEEQRESEELLHNGVAAFERGEIEAAKQMLTVAVQRGGAHDVALAFLTRIDRIHAATSVMPSSLPLPSRLPFRQKTEATPRASRRWAAAAFAVLLIGSATLATVSWDRLRSYVPTATNDAQDALAPARIAQEPLMVPRSAETALDRARALYESGRLHDALRAVELVRPTDSLRADADRLKAAIQRELLAFQTLPTGAAATAALPSDAGSTNPANATRP